MVNLWQEDKQWRYQITAYARGSARSVKVSRQATGSFGDIDEAKARELALTLERTLEIEAAKAVVLKEHDGILWGVLVSQWKAEEIDELPDPEVKVVRQSTQEAHYQRVVDFTQAWWKKPAKEIVPADIESLIRAMRKMGYSNSTIYNTKVSIKQVFDFGIKRRRIPGVTASPTIGFSISRKQSQRSEIHTLEQACTLVDEADREQHEWRNVWKTALHSGGRSGELHELRGKDLSQETRILVFQRQWNASEGRVTDLKDHEWRQVYISDELHEVFTEIGAYELGPEDLVLPRLKEWRQNRQAAVLREFCVKIGVPSICFHTLRAIWATQLLRNKVDRLTVQKMGGWATVDAMEHYIRLAGIDIEGATNSLSFKRKRGRPARVLKLVSGASLNED